MTGFSLLLCLMLVEIKFTSTCQYVKCVIYISAWSIIRALAMGLR